MEANKSHLSLHLFSSQNLNILLETLIGNLIILFYVNSYREPRAICNFHLPILMDVYELKESKSCLEDLPSGTQTFPSLQFTDVLREGRQDGQILGFLKRDH